MTTHKLTKILIILFSITLVLPLYSEKIGINLKNDTLKNPSNTTAIWDKNKGLIRLPIEKPSFSLLKLGLGTINDIEFLDGNTGYLCGEWGFMKYQDANITQIKNPVNARNINDLIFLSTSEGYAVGDNGKRYKFDGSEFREFTDSITPQNINSIKLNIGTSPLLVAVGDNGLLLESDGTNWSAMSGSESLTTENLNDVSFTYETSGSVRLIGFAVGDNGAILKWNGSNWIFENMPEEHVDLNAVWVWSTHEAYAAGAKGKIFKYNGFSWEAFYSIGDEYEFTSIYMKAPNEIYFAGSQGIIMKYDGNNLSHMLGSTRVFTGRINRIAMVFQDFGFCIGEKSTILYFDGTEWQKLTSSLILAGEDFNTIYLSSKTNGFIGGETGVLAKFKGNDEFELMEYHSSLKDILKIKMYDDSIAYLTTGENRLYKWNGTNFNGYISTNILETNSFTIPLRERVYVIGDVSSSVENYTVRVGDGWNAFSEVPGSEKTRMSGKWTDIEVVYTGATLEGFALADDGRIAKFEKDKITDITLAGSVNNFQNIFLLSEREGFVVGKQGTILHYTGSSWNQMAGVPTTGDINDIYMLSEFEGVTVGKGDNGPEILTWYNGNWEFATYPSGIENRTLNSLFFYDNTGGYIVGSGGTILKISSPFTKIATLETNILTTTSSAIYRAILTVDEKKNNQTIEYYLSADGGAHWEINTPGITHRFQESHRGTQLKLRAVLKTDDTSVSPEIYGFTVEVEITSQTPTQPGRPYHVTDTGNTAWSRKSQITFAWSPSTSDAGIGHYDVFVSRNNQPFTIETTTTVPSVTIGASHKETVSIYVQAYNIEGDASIRSEASETVTVDIMPPSSPQVASTNISTSSTTYVIQITKPSEDDFFSHYEIKGGGFGDNWVNVKQNTNIKVSVIPDTVNYFFLRALDYAENFSTPLRITITHQSAGSLSAERPVHVDEDARPGYDNDGTLKFIWPQTTTDNFGYYLVYISVNGGHYASGQRAYRNEYTFQGIHGFTYKAKVAAVNAFGLVGPPSSESDPVIVDLEKPEIKETYPPENESDVNVSTEITIKFSEPLLESSIKGENIVTLWEDKDGAAEITISYNNKNNTLIIKPVKPLKHGKEYTVTISNAQICDVAGNKMETSYSFKFTTQEPEDLKITDLRAYPNPSSQGADLFYKLNQDVDDVYIEIFSADGRRLRHLKDLTTSEGENQTYWDGKDRWDRFLATGTYFYRVTALKNGKKIRAFSKILIFR